MAESGNLSATCHPDGVDGLLPPWERYCRGKGLLITAPRRAILTTLLQQHQPIDAVALHQRAGQHHTATSLGTVYRLLRELQALGCLQIQARPRGRTLWQLHPLPNVSVSSDEAGYDALWPPWLAFLQQLETLGLAERQTTDERRPRPPCQQYPLSASTHDMLRDIMQRLGYRLT